MDSWYLSFLITSLLFLICGCIKLANFVHRHVRVKPKTEPPRLQHYLPNITTQDSALYFSLLPRELVAYIYLFLRRPLGIVRNPRKLYHHSWIETEINYPSHMCFDMHDNLFITSLEQHQVFVYDKHGKSITQRPHVSPYSCVVDSTGRLFVSQRLNNCVTIDGKRGFEVRAPQGLALNHEENLLYVCSYVICVFSTQNFCFAREIGRGVLYAPESVVVLSTGQIAVSALRSIHIFDASGLFVRKIGQDVLPCPCQLAVDAQDNVYVVDRDAQAIYIFTANGCLVNKLLQSEARGIAISSSGLVARSYCRMVELLTCDLPYGVKQYHYGLVKCAGDASPPAG